MTSHDAPTMPVEVISADGDHTDTWSADLADAEFAQLVKATKVITPVTRLLLVVLVAAAGFIGGVLVERSQQPDTATATTTGANPFRNAAAGASANGGGANGGGPGANATIGTITLIDGANVYVTTAEGDVVKVVTNPQTAISVSKNGTVGDLDPSKSVVVQGTTNPDGTVTASQITQGGFGNFGGGRRNGGAGANGNGRTSTSSGGG